MAAQWSKESVDELQEKIKELQRLQGDLKKYAKKSPQREATKILNKLMDKYQETGVFLNELQASYQRIQEKQEKPPTFVEILPDGTRITRLPPQDVHDTGYSLHPSEFSGLKGGSEGSRKKNEK